MENDPGHLYFITSFNERVHDARTEAKTKRRLARAQAQGTELNFIR